VNCCIDVVERENLKFAEDDDFESSAERFVAICEDVVVVDVVVLDVND
jgi:hypothetical protein